MQLAAAFMDAAAKNDMSRLSGLLAEDAVMISDGGGKRSAALRPMIGREDVMLLITSTAKRNGSFARPTPAPGPDQRPARRGDADVRRRPDHGLRVRRGRLALGAIYIMRSPDKLGHEG